MSPNQSISTLFIRDVITNNEQLMSDLKMCSRNVNWPFVNLHPILEAKPTHTHTRPHSYIDSSLFYFSKSNHDYSTRIVQSNSRNSIHKYIYLDTKQQQNYTYNFNN